MALSSARVVPPDATHTFPQGSAQSTPKAEELAKRGDGDEDEMVASAAGEKDGDSDGDTELPSNSAVIAAGVAGSGSCNAREQDSAPEARVCCSVSARRETRDHGVGCIATCCTRRSIDIISLEAVLESAWGADIRRPKGLAGRRPCCAFGAEQGTGHHRRRMARCTSITTFTSFVVRTYRRTRTVWRRSFS